VSGAIRPERKGQVKLRKHFRNVPLLFWKNGSEIPSWLKLREWVFYMLIWRLAVSDSKISSFHVLKARGGTLERSFLGSKEHEAGAVT
jgi:hypothetical protein